MMRNRLFSSLRSYLLPAFAAIVLAVGPIACSSTGEGELTPALDGAAEGEEAKPGNVANANAAATGENAIANANANAEAANTAKPEGAATANNPVGSELNNAIAGDNGGANAAAETPPANVAEQANSVAPVNGATNAAETSASAANLTPPSDANASAPVPADANLSNPFSAAAAASSEMPASSNALPMNTDAASAAAPDQASAGSSIGASAPATAVPESGAGEGSVTVSGPSSLPEMGSKMAYYVMRGDTLASIALKIYGSRAKWKSLQAENGLADANKIYPGDVIYYTLSDGSKAFAEKYELASRQSYTVSKGDALALLAAKFYGTQGAWRALWKENPHILNPDRIRVGMTLTYRVSEKVALKDEDESSEQDAAEELVQSLVVEDDEKETVNELFTAATE